MDHKIAMSNRSPVFVTFILILLSCITGSAMAASFTFTNNCAYTVWPGLLSGAGTAPLETTGFALQRGETRKVSTPSNWSGRFWGRTGCGEDPATGKFTCATADCGSGTVECSGSGAKPPATLAELTLAGANGLDFYDVSLVDGYNLPMSLAPDGGGSAGNCTATGCAVDLNAACPAELRVAAAGEGVGCRSACEAFNRPDYCCSGEYGSPSTCRPSQYSEFFKHNCPRAYSYAYDDGTSTFTCAGADYTITFCPSVSSQKTSGHPEAAGLADSSMVIAGGGQTSSAGRQSPSIALIAAVTFVLAAAQLWRVPAAF